MKRTRKSDIANPKAKGADARLIASHIGSALQAHGRWQAVYEEKLTWPELQDAASYDSAIDELLGITKDILANLEIARSMGSR